MIKIAQNQLEFIIQATIELSHAMGLMAKTGPSIVFVGSNKITPDSLHKDYFDLAVEIAEVMGKEGWNCIAGGGGGLNQAVTLGSSLGGAKSVGIKVLTEFKANRLPDVPIKVSNPFNRKVLFDLFSDAYIFFPGGYGTLEALFEVLTLQQTRKAAIKPIICVGESYWKPLLQPIFDRCLETEFKTINPADPDMIHYTDNYRDIARIIWEHRSKTLGEENKNVGLPNVPSPRNLAPDADWAQNFARKVAMELAGAYYQYHNIGKGLSIFGSARSKPGSDIYEETVQLAETLGKVLVSHNQNSKIKEAIVTGGGPGSMEAANKGAQLAGAPSLGLGIDLALEVGFNPYVDKELQYEFNYFFCRKWIFSALTDTFIATPGGFGTFDELFEMMAMKQHHQHTDPKRANRRIVCVNRKFYTDIMENTQSKLMEAGFIVPEHKDLAHFEWDSEEAAEKLSKTL